MVSFKLCPGCSQNGEDNAGLRLTLIASGLRHMRFAVQHRHRLCPDCTVYEAITQVGFWAFSPLSHPAMRRYGTGCLATERNKAPEAGSGALIWRFKLALYIRRCNYNFGADLSGAVFYQALSSPFSSVSVLRCSMTSSIRPNSLAVVLVMKVSRSSASSIFSSFWPVCLT